MEEENKRRIQGNYKDLVDNVRPVDIQDYLVQAGVLSDEEQNLISLPSIVPQEGLFQPTPGKIRPSPVVGYSL